MRHSDVNLNTDLRVVTVERLLYVEPCPSDGTSGVVNSHEIGLDGLRLLFGRCTFFFFKQFFFYPFSFDFCNLRRKDVFVFQDLGDRGKRDGDAFTFAQEFSIMLQKPIDLFPISIPSALLHSVLRQVLLAIILLPFGDF